MTDLLLGDNWLGHILFHTIGFFVFTLPFCYVLITFLFNEPFTLSTLGSVALGAAIVVLVMGLIKYGLDFSLD